MNDSERRGEGRPAYGAMRSDYPAYDPYLYGAPDPSPSSPSAGPAAPSGARLQPQPQSGPRRNPARRGRSSHRYGVDLDDPRQNPLYGHWDPYAVISLVFAILFANMPLLPAVVGVLAMWRTRTFRMKGFGLALAAVIINVLTSLVVLWAAYNGMSLQDMILDMYGIGSGSNGSGGGTVQAIV
ncbi:hypothetical protein G1C96_0466 [Bifidobacterium sp. DSM 109958]|uniref:DUF4190 domain-containing protein n=1 Tax=Bifidobacterium moraviense TaxID=2675323 RepID=A0A7Y0HYL5_9BIFI|nr:DUF4190 domain-containing protein [Bifidobacterium sp. DSM 109958]NMM99888.1 hypothetical protein [Bifidobacterium sp. DSM 109958]